MKNLVHNKIIKVLCLAALVMACLQAEEAHAQKKQLTDMINEVWLKSNFLEHGILQQERTYFESVTGCVVQIKSNIAPKPDGITRQVVDMWDGIIRWWKDADNVVSIELYWTKTDEGYSINSITVIPNFESGLFPDISIAAFIDSIRNYKEATALLYKADVQADERIAAALKTLQEQVMIKEGAVTEKKFLENTKLAYTSADRASSEKSLCNLCVRSALLLLKRDTVLFPLEGSVYCNPYNDYNKTYPKGKITNPGQEKDIRDDFSKISNHLPLKGRFEEIKKDTISWATYFKKLQDEADKGFIIVGVMQTTSGGGHVMMITPGGLINIKKDKKKEELSEERFGKSFTDNSVHQVPRILECGLGVRENEAPLCRNVDWKGATQRLKWFKYKK
jgi:hypothetical protein